MIDLRAWSFARVLLASALWVVLIVCVSAAFLVLRIYLEIRSQSQSTGSAGIGAVSLGISEALTPLPVLILFGPPVALALRWWFLRRS